MAKATIVTLTELADLLKGQRLGMELTQAEVAEAAGKNAATVTCWEAGTTEPGALALTRACQFMGVTPNDVLLTNTKDRGVMEKLTPAQRVQFYRLAALVRPILEETPDFLDALCKFLAKRG